jgi:uncharacterized protein (TIGR03790 family)
MKRHTGRFIILFLLAASLWPPAAALALAPQDLVVVFNENLPESREVAAHYARHRQVPEAQLLGVAVTTAERMSREEFDRQLAPPVRREVERLKRQGRRPAILLVYGIPLAVNAPGTPEYDRTFQDLAARQLADCRRLVLDLLFKLRLLAEQEPAEPAPAADLESLPTPELLRQAREIMERAGRLLEPSEPPALEPLERLKISSLLLRLTGTSAAAAGLAARGRQDRQKLQEQELLKMHALVQMDLEHEAFFGLFPDQALIRASGVRVVEGVLGELAFWEQVHSLITRPEAAAAVDSELTLVLANRYQRARWRPNPFLPQLDHLPFIKEVRENTVMVGRLDGPTPAIARRLVDDALEVEKSGLQGIFYLDARGLAHKESLDYYAQFDRRLVELYARVRKFSPLKAVLDERPEVFPPDSCPQAALYCGWYSLRSYVPAFEWVKGAVAYHVASAEATTLRKPWSNVWCKRMLEEGVAATLGPVEEPYLQSFPPPEEFFPLLMSGQLPLLEVYFRTVPHLSWRQILIGDPLYNPFRHKPAIKGGQVKER